MPSYEFRLRYLARAFIDAQELSLSADEEKGMPAAYRKRGKPQVAREIERARSECVVVVDYGTPQVLPSKLGSVKLLALGLCAAPRDEVET